MNGIRTLRVSEKGQIVIPNLVRQRLGINQGDDLVLIEIDGKILLEKSKNVSDRLIDGFGDVLKFSENSLGEVWNNKEDDVWGEYLNDES